MVLNRYIELIQAYEEDKNTTGILFVYAVMFRRVFIFDIPEYTDEDIIEQFQNQQSTGQPNLLQAISNFLPKLNLLIGGEKSDHWHKVSSPQ